MELLAAEPGADLRRARLDRVDLSALPLHRADLRGAALRDASLVGAELYFVDLRGAYLAGADFSSANLRGARIGPDTKIDDARCNGKTVLPDGFICVENRIFAGEARTLHEVDVDFSDVRRGRPGS